MSLLRRAPAPDLENVLSCPRDGAALETVVREGVTIDRCGTCRGMWFDKGELRRVSGERRVEREATRGRIVPVQSDFACIRCGGVSHLSFIEEVSVDACSACHGVWLDGGELEEARRQVEVRRIMEQAGPSFRTFLARL